MKDRKFTDTCPTHEEVRDATRVLNRFMLRVYQILYFSTPPLAQPGGTGRYLIELNLNAGHITPYLKITRATHADYAFSIRADEMDKVLHNTALIEEAISAGKQKVHRLACCPLAEQTFCVCLFSSSCPLHGQQCHGTHE